MKFQARFRAAMMPVLCLAVLGKTGFLSLRSAEPAPAAPEPVTIVAGPDWIPFETALDIEAGSALDFSQLGMIDAPAGKHGRVLARADGRFVFEKSPEVARRFYGINLCFGAHYVSHEEADRLAERLVRLGYNALRIHHYERDLVQRQEGSTRLNPERLERFDYLMAALIQRGIYLTTDLYVSRSVPYREIGMDRDGNVPMDTFKILVPVHEGAWENWTAFSRALLDHVNPYTGRRYADEPALAWLSMINEGNLGNFYREILAFDAWQEAWNRWLTAQYPDRATLATAWNGDLADAEDPVNASVKLPENLSGAGPRSRDAIRFLSDTERGLVQRMKTFLADELNCRALVSNANSWTYFVTDQGARTVYDYVDDHFYVDHPQFLEQPWRLPSRCPNTSPIADGATGGRSKTFTRIFNKPFTITEFNYSGPGRFRGVGGILTGALGAIQGWDGIWRFAYSHNREAMFKPSRMGYFDLASDPLSLAAERASLCLFLRGDLATATNRVALTMTEADLANPAARIPRLAPRWHWLAWVTRVGTDLVATPADAAGDLLVPLGWQTPASEFPPERTLSIDPYQVEDSALWQVVRQRGLVANWNATDPSRKLYQSESGGLTIDASRDMLVIDTARTAGGYAPAGQVIATAQGRVQIRVEQSPATVWISSLDDRPIRGSRRLLVTHLTDLQNSGIKYAEPERQTLLDWGRLPHLVRAGRAEITVRSELAGRLRVWALAPGGRRLSEVQTRTEGDALKFTADVGADPAQGARMLYEVAVP
jgi:hypothetical protein